MIKVYLTLLLLAVTFSSFAQKTEFSVFANTGLSKFRGESTSRETSLSAYTNSPEFNYTMSPYGAKPALSVGGGVQVQRVTAAQTLFGIQAGIDVLRSRSTITAVYTATTIFSSASSTMEKAEGKAILQNTLVNLHPYIGHRWQAGTLDVDATLGMDVGYVLDMRVRSKATTDSGISYESANRDMQSGPTLDVRPRAGIAVYKGQLGVSASYAAGLINYYQGLDGGNFEARQHAFRLGLHYRL